jgi:predicted HicB family RNase H-like nuclease
MNDIIQYKDFLASVHFSSEDEVFYGKVLGINDLISFEGSSVRELKKSFQEAIEDYLETCEQVGKEPNKTYKGTFNVRIPTQLHKEAAVFAAVIIFHLMILLIRLFIMHCFTKVKLSEKLRLSH